MKKMISAFILSLICAAAMAQEGGQMGTFSGRLMKSHGNLLVLYNDKVDASQQLMINPAGQRGRDLTLLYNYCQDYCVVKGIAIRAADYTGQFQVFWLTRLNRVFNPQTPEANATLLGQGQNAQGGEEITGPNGQKIIRRDGGATDGFIDYEGSDMSNYGATVTLPQY